MRCLNSFCRKEFNGVEINHFKFSFKRFCIKCRINKERVFKIDCVGCGNEIPFNLTKSNVISVLCINCRKLRRKKQKVGYYHKKYKYKNTMSKKILDILDSGKLVSMEECMRTLKISKRSLQQTVFNLNKKGKGIKKMTLEYYYINTKLLN